MTGIRTSNHTNVCNTTVYIDIPKIVDSEQKMLAGHVTMFSGLLS